MTGGYDGVAMRAAIVTFDGYDELDTFVTLGLLNGLAALGWKAEITAPSARVTSINGVTVEAQQPLEWANEADIVVFASCLYARAMVEDTGRTGSLLDQLRLDPVRQTVAAHGSGALLMARFGLLADMPACADAATAPWLTQSGIRVEEASFHAQGSIATAAGALASVYTAAWLAWRGAGETAARQALQRAAPVGEKVDFVERALDVVRAFVPVA